MVVITKEKNARRIFRAYRGCVAFSLCGSNGMQDEDANINISYAKLNFLPDKDEINAVLNGDLKGRKVIRQAVSALHGFDSDSQNIAIPMAQMINMVAPDKGSRISKDGPVVLIFVLDDNDNDDRMVEAKNKFLTKYITALFAEFGIEPVTDKKTIKKLFSVGKKLKKKDRKAVIERVARFMDKNKNVRISNDGMALKKLLFTFYSTSLHATGLLHADPDKLGEKSRKILAKNLVQCYTNNNIPNLGKYGLKKKALKKLCKRLKKSNLEITEAYQVLREILVQIDPNLKMPKVENGYSKKAKKKMAKGKKADPKMNVDKFMDFFKKKKNVNLLTIIYAHTSCVTMGVDIGTKEYVKFMEGVLDTVADDSFTKSFVSAAKAYAKAANVTAG